MYVYIYVYIYPYLTKAQANEAYKRRCEKRAQRLQLHQHHCQHQLRPFNCRSYNCSKWALTNIRSLCNKQNDFALFLAVESPDVVCVTETWLHADIPDSLLCLLLAQSLSQKQTYAMMCFSVTVMTFKAEFTWFI